MRKLAGMGVIAVLVAVCAVGVGYYWTSRERHTTPSVVTGLDRQFSGNVLTSPADPGLRISIDPSLQYIGGQKFTLYGVAAVEQHVFGRKWPDGSPRSVVLFQFESVLPGIDWKYDYSGARYRSAIDGFDFFTDIEPGRVWWLFPNGKPGTDGYRAKSLAGDAGFAVPEDYIWHRSVHIPNADARSELLIIWQEDLSPTGMTRDDFPPQGAGSPEWDEIARESIAELNGLIEITRIED